MWWTIGKAVLKVYAVLWMTAVGGIVGANLAAVIGMLFFAPENKSVYIRPWAHTGWYIGTALCLIGAVTGKLRFVNGTSLGSRPQPAPEDGSAAVLERTAPAQVEQPKARRSLLKCAFDGGLVGGICGFILGASLLVFWFSLAYSPFASRKVSSSVKIAQQQSGVAAPRRNVLQTNHPVALYLCLSPALAGIVAGAVAGPVLVFRYGDDELS